MNNVFHFILHLSLIDNVGPGLVQRILKQCHAYEPEQWYSFSESDFINLFGMSEKTAACLAKGLRNKTALEQELKLIEKSKVQVITILDPEYPVLLKEINLPPPLMYIKGTLPRGQNNLAVVGSREADQYGYAATRHLVAPLVQQGWAIISGGALGIDAIAHQTAVDNGGITVAVMGSGLLNLYPKPNYKLFDQIIEKGGALVSSFPLLMEGFPHNFPARNRIISGLSRGCLVVQAAAKSGARITADFCLAQGREVFAVPGLFDSYLSAGCHGLIQQGAKLTTRVDDILSEFGQEYKPALKEEKPVILPIFDTPKGISNVVEDSIDQKILNACRQPSSIDELLDQTGIPLIELTHLLFNLQIKGKICQNMAGLWERP